MAASRPLYPVSDKPRVEKKYKVSDIHEIHTSEYGNPDGIPAVVFHGGPGSGCREYFAGYFDPEKYRIILVDQRGSGKSTPKGEMKDNNTQALMADMEVVRKDLGIDKWVICGGSWGSTLALLYAEAHPNNVLSLILRGVWLGRDKDLTDFLRDGSMASQLHSMEWVAYKSDIQKLLLKAGLNVETDTSDDHYIIDANYALLTEGNETIKLETARLLAQWEKLNSYLETKDVSAESASPDGVNMGLTEAVFMKNRCFIKENQILDNLASIFHIPIYIVQGKYDLVCPRGQSVDLELAHQLNKGVVVRHDPIAGHAGNEPGIIDGLVKSTDHFALNYQLKKEKTVSLAGSHFGMHSKVVTQDSLVPPTSSEPSQARRLSGPSTHV